MKKQRSKSKHTRRWNIRLCNIRRCKFCNVKTHRRFWVDDRCPVCGSSIGFSLSSHGGVSYEEIEESRKAIKEFKGKGEI